MRSNKFQQLLHQETFISSLLAIICVSILATSIFFLNTCMQTSVAMKVSVSSDGKYALSSHLNGEIMLWNIAHKTQQKIADHANIYSAYFIKNTHDLMWQDLHNTVHIQDISGNKILSFQNKFPVYGQVITTDLQHYFASDQAWNLFMGYGLHQVLIKSSYGINGFFASGKLLNLTLSNNNKYLLTSGDAERSYDFVTLAAGISAQDAKHKGYPVGILNASLLEGVVLWDVSTGKPIYKFPGNEVKTFATLSPDNHYVVNGDENQLSMIWFTQNGKKHLDVDIANPDWPDDINIPLLKNHVNAILSLKFIDDENYLRFIHQLFNYVVLYNIDHDKPVKLIFIGNDFPPAVNDFSRDEAIDTTPAAHILVAAQATGSGIIVYQYHPDTQTLERIWTPGGPGPRRVAL